MLGGIEDDFHDGLTGDEKFRDRLMIFLPDFGRDGVDFFPAVFEVKFDQDGHDDASLILEAGNSEVLL